MLHLASADCHSDVRAMYPSLALLYEYHETVLTFYEGEVAVLCH